MTKEMTVKEYLEKYGEIEIIDNGRIFRSNPEKKAIGGMITAGDINRIGIF